MKAKIVRQNGKYFIRCGWTLFGYTYLDNTMNEDSNVFDYKWWVPEIVVDAACFDTVVDAEAKWEAYKAFKQRDSCCSPSYKNKVIKTLK